MNYFKLYNAVNLFVKLANLTPDEARKILGVHPNASSEEINKKYKKLMFTFHPDRNSNPDAMEKVLTLNSARDVLISNPANDPLKRDKEVVNDIDDYLKKEQERADAYVAEVRARREEWTNFSNGKIKVQDLKWPENIAVVERIKQNEREYKKRRAEERKANKK